ncbi:MAG: hypothetical protein ACI8UO_000561 [Verrucomicrobiales bacterium]|jgi:hypothetical protein
MKFVLPSLIALIPVFAASGQIQFRSDLEDSEIEEKQANYSETLQQLLDSRDEFRKNYQMVPSGAKRAEVIEEVRKKLTSTLLTRILPAWYGTEWDFNGVSQTPGEGQIACGYFVTTCLRDAGMNLERVKLAQQASQRIIKTVADPETIKIIYDKPIEDVAAYLEKSGPGIYIVGLDTHTGFVVNDGENHALIHSSYYKPPFSVTAEPIDGRNPLAHSKYRVIGKILDDEMIRKWLMGEAFPMKE